MQLYLLCRKLNSVLINKWVVSSHPSGLDVRFYNPAGGKEGITQR